MFRQRLLTTLVLVPLVLFTIYYANSWLLIGVILLLLLGCGLEWLALVPIQQVPLKLLFIAAILGLSWFSYYGFNCWLLVGMLLWLGIGIAVLSFPASQHVWGYPLVVTLAGLILLPLFGQSLLQVYQLKEGKDLVVYLLFIVWATDIGAYLIGRQWGQHKLIPQVSPGKTVEGACGGFILALLITCLGYYYFAPKSALNWFLIAIVTIFIAMIGDLFISMLKRRTKLKDTGHLLPGHGGVLDRLDSLIAALPLFYCGLVFLAPGL